MTVDASTLTPSWPPKPRRREPDGHWSLRRWLLVMGSITGVFAVAAVALAWVALAWLTQARFVVVQEIGPALRASKDLTVAVADQESGVRGFVLTSREEALAQYAEGQAQEQRAAAELRRFAAGGRVGDLRPGIDQVAAHLQAWRTAFAEPAIATVRARQGSEVGPAPVDPALVDSALGADRTEAARAAVNALDATLEGELAVATAQLRSAANFLLIVFAAIAVGLVALVVVVGVWLRRSVTTPLSRLAGEVRQVVAGDAHREVHGGGPLEVVQLADDIDAMRRHILAELDALELARQRLDEQATDLERSNRDLEQFAYVASHDLQEPLRKVSSFCQLLQRRYGGQLDERGESYIEFAVDGARRMQQLINDLLAFSRVGRSVSSLAAVDLSAAAQAAVAQLAVVIQETDAQISMGELPVVRGDESLLTQLLANLVGNALKFHRPGVAPMVTISALSHQDGWEVQVTDNGIGVEPEYVDKVFVIFQRLHAREDYPGTGIGLAMAKKIVEYHGGRIWIDPELDHGTTVRFTLPAYTEEPAP